MPSTSPRPQSQGPPRAIFIAMFTVGLSGLIFEIALTRLFSLYFQYHFVFLAVSIAVFGLSLGAALARVIGPGEPGELPVRLVQLLAGLSILFPVVTLLIALLPSTASIWPRALLSVLPFVGAGFFNTLVFENHSQNSGALYATELIGSASGVVAVIFLLDWMSAFTLLYLLGVVLALTALYLGGALRVGQARIRFAAAGAALAIAAVNLSSGVLDYNPYLLDAGTAPRDKTMLFVLNDPAQEAEIIRTAHSPFARVDVVESSDPSSLFVFTDGGAGGYMLRYEGGAPNPALLLTIEALPFTAAPPETALIIGSGGGKDVLMALAAGAAAITAVEVNPGIIEVTNELADYNGRIYNLPEVELEVGDGRNFAERTGKSFDLIYLNLVYSQAAEPAGQALVENYIFTEEAFEAYYSRLAAGGHLAVVTHNALEGSRAALTALKALQNLGIPPDRGLDHLALWMYPSDDPTTRTSVMLLGRDPLTPETLENLTSGAQALGMDALFSPGDFEFLFATLRRIPNVDTFIDPGADYDLSPTTDDRPFFFKLDFGMPPAIRQAFSGSFFLAAALFIISLASPQQQKRRVELSWWVMVVYVALIGAGYLLVEIPLIQRLQVLLGYPMLTLGVTLGTLLFASGIGSYMSQRWKIDTLPRRVPGAAFAVAALAIAYRFALPVLVEALLPFGTVARVLVVVLLVALIGVPMGIPLPSAMRMAGAASQQISLLWAVNGASSLLGSVSAVLLSMSVGFSAALLLGAFCYLALTLLAWQLLTGVPLED